MIRFLMDQEPGRTGDVEPRQAADPSGNGADGVERYGPRQLTTAVA
ncbi:hypothetical protein AB0M86_22745 [Streptomyces sp. NPDC051639]